MTRSLAWYFAQALSLATLIGFFWAEYAVLVALFPERFAQ